MRLFVCVEHVMIVRQHGMFNDNICSAFKFPTLTQSRIRTQDPNNLGDLNPPNPDPNLKLTPYPYPNQVS